MLVVLSGGTGTPKFLQGLKENIKPKEITVIANTAEDKWLPHGYFCPDIDAIIYTLADIIDEDKWYGIKGDTFNVHEKLLDLGYDEFLNIGDMDRATHILRGWLMKNGMSLSKTVDYLRTKYRVKAKIYPMSNDRVETVVVTPQGKMNLHQYLVKNKGKPKVEDIFLDGIEEANALKDAVKAIKKAKGIIIGPSNPISSILPIISLNEIKKVLIEKKEKCLAISPIIGKKPISGPAGRFMRTKGLEVSPHGVAEFYKDIIAHFVIHPSDSKKNIERLGIKCYQTNIIMKNLADKKALAKFVLNVLI
jgi:LPPG:FO 2-phospho-L-lactate transferase